MKKNPMKRLVAYAFTAALLAACAAPLAPAAAPAAPAQKPNETQENAQIEKVLRSYEQSLNASDVKGVMRLYTDDAVLLPQATPTVVGIKAVEQFYVGTFQAVQINLKFKIAEVQVSNDWAFLRTNSTGTMKILATGVETPAQTQELFVLHKTNGQWKLARYAFSSTLPTGM